MNSADQSPAALPPLAATAAPVVGNLAMSHAIPADIRVFMESIRGRSHSPISRYRVSVVGETEGFDLIPGVNIEFPGTTLNETIHGEQTVVAVAHAREIPRLDTIYLDGGAPCGHCRQQLHELAIDPVIWLEGQAPQRLSAYLPDAFGPKDLGVEGGALSAARHELQFEDPALMQDRAAALALEFACRSYAPYTKTYGAVVLTLNDGRLCPGAYIENAAFNPTLSPFHSAVANLIAGLGGSFEEIAKVTLVAVPNDLVDHHQPIARLLRASKVECPVEIYTARSRS